MQYLNNIKLKYKLLMVYLLCVILPIISINYIFYDKVSDNVRVIQRNYYRLSTERIKNQLEKDLEEVTSLFTKISVDQNFYKALERNYQKDLDYVKTYYNYLKPFLTLNNDPYEQINNITIYTDNDSILNSGMIFKIDREIKSKEWYQTTMKDPDSIHLIYHKQENNDKKVNIFVTKVLNQYRGLNKYNKILKIEISSSYIMNKMNEIRRGNIYLLNQQEKVLFSTHNSSSYKPDYRNSVVVTITNRYLNWKIINVMDKADIDVALEKPRNSIILLTLISLVFSSIIIYILFQSFYSRINGLSKHVNSLQKDFNQPFCCGKGNDEIGILIDSFNKLVGRIKVLINDVYEAKLKQSQIEVEKKQAELNALQSQLNPHFLFNTLESIRMKSIEKDERETAKIIKYLARSFRWLVDHEKEWISVEQELQYVNDFLKIQKYRFGYELDYQIKVDSGILQYKIPKMVIQPFIENACIHGLEGIDNTGKVFLDIKLLDEKLHCIIKDNGIGIEKSHLEKLCEHIREKEYQSSKIGIKNVYRRLNLYFGDDFKLNIASERFKGTCITLIIPIEED